MPKSTKHECAACGDLCPRDYPFCVSCWRSVPKDLRAQVKTELVKRQTPDLDRSALYFAVQNAAESVRVSVMTEGAAAWESLWTANGCPELEIVGGVAPKSHA